MIQFTAMLRDAYRELNSKKLFWIIMGLTIVSVVGFGSIGFGPKGMTFFFGLTSVENEVLTRDSPVARILYRAIFKAFLVDLWLTWAATILALIATTTIFPDFIARGAIDLVLAKPISRLRLFLYKYFFGLLFMVLEVTVLSIGAVLTMGLRLDDWAWEVLLAIPVVTLFFSYLYAVNVFLGVVTRSALAALLGTIVFWAMLFALALTVGIIDMNRIPAEMGIEQARQRVTALEARITENPEAEDRLAQLLETSREELVAQEAAIAPLARWRDRIQSIRSVLPKTSETIELLDRALRRDSDINFGDIMQGNVEPTADGGFRAKREAESEAAARMDAEQRALSLWWILGTSILFEAGVIAAAAIVFIRRDY